MITLTLLISIPTGLFMTYVLYRSAPKPKPFRSSHEHQFLNANRTHNGDQKYFNYYYQVSK